MLCVQKETYCPSGLKWGLRGSRSDCVEGIFLSRVVKMPPPVLSPSELEAMAAAEPRPRPVEPKNATAPQEMEEEEKGVKDDFVKEVDQMIKGKGKGKQRKGPSHVDGSAQTGDGATDCSSVFPPGVESLEHWGLTIIQFGKTYVGKSYDEALEIDSGRSYVKWLKANVHRCVPEVQDFLAYVNALRCESPVSQSGFFIPGSETIRTFKGASST